VEHANQAAAVRPEGTEPGGGRRGAARAALGESDTGARSRPAEHTSEPDLPHAGENQPVTPIAGQMRPLQIRKGLENLAAAVLGNCTGIPAARCSSDGEGLRWLGWRLAARVTL